MEGQESQNIQNIDNELKALKEKKHKLEEISSQLRNIKEKKDSELSNSNLKKTTKNMSTDNDAEKLVLTKQEILDFCDKVLEKWEGDPNKDARYVFAMNAVKTSILWTEEDTLKEIWNEIIHWIFELLYKNAIAQGNEENLEWSKIMQKLNEHL